MTFRLLGSLQAEGAEGMSLPLGPPKQRALLAILLLHVGEIVSTDRLIDLLWGDRAPRTANHSIQIYVSELRRTLAPLAGHDAILTRPPGYQLNVAADEVDAKRFERLVAQGARALAGGSRSDGMDFLRDALRLWRGPALTDFTYEEFAQPYIRRLHDLHLDAIEELAAAELAAGRAAAVLPLAQAAVQEDPLRERSRELLMLALHRTGRHAEALRTYQKLSELLREELGLEPSPALQRLQEQIIVHDPELGPSGTGAEASTAAGDNPYRGLQPFGEADSDNFFGRDELIDRLEAQLRDGARVLAIVGPSGSGKSSVVAAGLVPRARPAWTVTPVAPNGDGLAAINELAVSPPAPTLLVIDQFEELFTITDERFQKEFLHALVRAIATERAGAAVVLTLRADFYDRPLLYPSFAPVFLAGLINVLPMTAEELEASIVGPAERVGVRIEPALLASLIADTADQPGALPLLQYALTELFEQRTGPTLTLAEYRRLGGLRGLVSRRAEELFAPLDADEQRTAKQVFLRLVRPGRGTGDFKRRLRLSELTATDLDPVRLSRVLESYGRHRLLSFDREDVTGSATAEVAHEALLWEWDRLAGWIDRHRTALRRHETFVSLLEDWEESGRDAGFLLTGSRLDEFVAWRSEGVLDLTEGEREFLAASEERQSVEQHQAELRSTAMRRLQRRSRVSLLVATAATVLIALGLWSSFTANVPSRVALLFHAAGEVDELIEAGFDRGVSEFGLVSIERDTDVESAEAALEALSAEAPDLIIVTTLATDVDAVAARHPDIRYVTSIENAAGTAANVVALSFADHEGAFLAGAVAALHSDTGTVGFVGGIDLPNIRRFQAGFEAGAREVDPQVAILIRYLTTPPDYEGFVSPELGETAASEMFREGADVIFHAAGSSGTGVFEAAWMLSPQTGRHLWVIGVDSDQYQTVNGIRASSWREHILTSMVKRLDLAVYEALASEANGQFTAGIQQLGLGSNAIELTYSGGFIDNYQGQLDALRDRIISGAIAVPCIPLDREGRSENQGADSSACPD